MSVSETSCPRSEQASGASQGTRDQSRAQAVLELERFNTAWFVHEVFPDKTAGRRLGVNLGGNSYFVDEVVRRVRPGPELVDAAKNVLRGFQDDLLTLGSPVEYQVARRLMRERLWAITALTQRGQSHDVNAALGHGYAKRVLLEVTDGVPLTICMGEAYAIRDSGWSKKTMDLRDEDAGPSEIGFTVRGCLSVFPDVTRTTGGHMWPWFCEDCRSKRRHPARDQGRELRSRLKRMRRGKGATLYESSFHIATGDGEER